jgi:hypothetical protein
MNRVVTNQANATTRVVFGKNENTGEVIKLIMFNPVKKTFAEVSLLKRAKQNFKKSTSYTKVPKLISSNKF